MNRKFVIGLLFAAALGLVAQTASAATLSWVELGFKSSTDGTAYDNPFGSWPPPGAALSLDASGLGTVKYSFSGAGPHYVVGFFDYQFVDAALGDGLDDEYGVVHGAPGAGQSFDVDDPWLGAIYGAFTAFDAATPLDDSSDLPPAAAGDMAVALGYAFTGPLDVTFIISKVAPTSGFYLEHRNPKSSESVYFSLSTKGGTPVPEPATLGLLGLGLAAAGRRLRRRS